MNRPLATEKKSAFFRGNAQLRSARALVLAATAALLAACSAGSSSGSATGGSSSGTTNIVGQALTGGSAVSLAARRGMRNAHASTLANCTAVAYDLISGAQVATGSSDANGKFTITSGNFTAGYSYKVVATCGTNSYTSVMTADNADASGKTPGPVNPATTVVSAVLTSGFQSTIAGVDSGTFDATTKAKIKSHLIDPANFNGVASAVTGIVQSALDSGAMEECTTDCGLISEAMASGSDGKTAYTGHGHKIIKGVSNAVSGATGAAAGFASGCDPTLGGTALLCTAAVAEMMYNVIHFDVAVLETGGAFGDTSACAAASLATAFPGAAITELSSGVLDTTGHTYCYIHNKVPQTDRNSSPSSQNGGGGGGPMFAETDTINGGAAEVTNGLLTALGSALYSGTAFTLHNIDQIVFGSSGLNARLMQSTNTVSWATQPSPWGGNYGYKSAGYYLLATSNGTNSATSFTMPTGCDGNNSDPCDPTNGNLFTFTTQGNWTTNTNGNTQLLSTALGTSAWTGSVFYDVYGGAIPSEADLVKNIVNSTTHRDENRTGQSQFYVLYSEATDWSDPNCQWSSSPSASTTYTLPNGRTIPGTARTTTQLCVGVSGAEQPAVTVNVSLGTIDPSTGLSPVANIDTVGAGTLGAYYVMPSMNGQFSGVLQLVNASTGNILTDELFTQRYVYVVLDGSSQCNAHIQGNGSPTLPTVGNGCGTGALYNIAGSWNCGGNQCAFQISAIGSQIGGSFTMLPTYNGNVIGNGQGPGIVGAVSTGTASGFSNSYTPIVVTVNADGTIASATTSNTAPSAGHYNIAPYSKCTQDGGNWSCSNVGYFLVSSGTFYTNGGALGDGLANLTIAQASNNNTSGVCLSTNWSDCNGNTNMGFPVLYTDTYFGGLAGTFKFGDGSAGSWQKVAQNVVVNMGPAVNPSFDCTLDPFFLDADHSGTIHYTANATTGINSCSTPTFGYAGLAADYVWEMTPSGSLAGAANNAYASEMTPNPSNAYVYSDPKGASSLMHVAFGSMMDGKHTLTPQTTLNGLQVFGLVYMFLSSNNNQVQVPNLLTQGSTSDYVVLMPACGSSAVGCNNVFGTGFTTYHQ